MRFDQVSLYVREPALAYVAPGLEVVADWDSPVFLVDGVYWYWEGGVWYRSVLFGGERVRVDIVPETILHIERPWRFAHYHATRARPLPEHRH